jgi:hypothetical protein
MDSVERVRIRWHGYPLASRIVAFGLAQVSRRMVVLGAYNGQAQGGYGGRGCKRGHKPSWTNALGTELSLLCSKEEFRCTESKNIAAGNIHCG